MSLSTTIGVGPYTTVVMPSVGIGPPGAPGVAGPPGDAQVSFGDPTAYPNLSPIRFVGVLNHAGPPVALDGTFLLHDVCWDSTGQQWMCGVAGTPGTWLAVGSGKVLGSVRISSQFIMSGIPTEVIGGFTTHIEDIAAAFFSFTYDGRPVFFRTTPLCTSLSPAGGGKLIQLAARRSSDSAFIGNAYREQETSLAGQIQPHLVDAGPFTAWPSDGAPFVVGTSYQVKLSISAPAGFLAATNAGTQPFTFYAITA